MANYSAQKIKSVSLNKEARRYANHDDSVAPKSATPQASSSRPLINPLSEAESPPEPAPAVVPKKPPVAFDWDGMFHRTFFSVYMDKHDPLIGPGKFDYVFNVGLQRLYVLVQQDEITVNHTEVSVKELADLKQGAAADLTKRFHQITAKIDVPALCKDESLDRIHYIGLTSLAINNQDNSFQVEHEYGSLFFQEDCVLDLDDEDKVIQLFSLNSFYQIVKLLQTPTDMLSFFGYHLSKLVGYQEFSNELDLAQDYLSTPQFFERAVNVQKKLVEIGLLAKVESRLTDITENSESENCTVDKMKVALVEKLQSYANMYQKLLNSTTKRRHEAGDTIPVEQVCMLVDESMYTRLSIIEEMIAYENRSEMECMQGYMCHQHSYNEFGRHYVIIVYGLAADAEYSRESIQQNYQSMLMDINAQLQDPAMSEYFILAFDMSNHDGKGNVSVQIDVYHQSGSEMSEIERRYYEQSQALA